MTWVASERVVNGQGARSFWASVHGGMSRKPGLAVRSAVTLLGVALLSTALTVRLGQGRDGCISGPGPLTLCAASDMAKLPNHGPVPLEGPHLDLRTGTGIELRAARNETVAFQIVLRGKATSPTSARLKVSDLEGPSGARLPADTYVQRFLEHYVWVSPGGYTWGPPSKVLPWPDFYPDALIPFRSSCGERRRIVEEIKVPTPDGANQAIWVDVYVPPEQPPGSYSGRITVEAEGDAQSISLRLQVRTAVLPDRPTIDAVGEAYDAYRREGVGEDMSSEAWRRIAHCYHQVAHAHRVVFVERKGWLGPDARNPGARLDEWQPYDLTVGPLLTGELFTPARGYVGPGQNVAVTVWRIPWPQLYNGRLENPLSDAELARYEASARLWDEHAVGKGWTNTRYFAYVFDEVDGPRDIGAGEAPPAAAAYLVMAHREMKRLQRALDAGATRNRIDLMWTSHSDPSQWQGLAGLDLVGTIRLWVPAAEAAPPGFLTERARQGERIWFYHAGHPFIGVHSINASGIDLRTWGLAAARYGFHGQFMWAVNAGDPENPYNKPSYKSGEDRFGNGTLVYPGAMLTTIGFPPAPGPIPSMRLKAWRRGLEDAALVQVARQAGHGEEVDRLLRELIPVAFADARGQPSWPQEPGPWEDFRRKLLDLASP